MTASVAARGVIAEAGGAGQLEEHAVAQLTHGTRNALRHLGMLPGEPEPPRSTTITRFEWLYSVPAGFWVAEIKTGEPVAKGQKLGEIRDLYGESSRPSKRPPTAWCSSSRRAPPSRRTASCSA